MDWIYDLAPGPLVLGLLALLFVANEVGYRFGLRSNPDESERSRSVSSGIKTAIFGLVALLLAFSYSMSSGRYMGRVQLVVDEANAIGTCYLRADLLSEPARGTIRTALRRYTDLRIEHFAHALEAGEYNRTTAGMDSCLTALWSGVKEAAQEDRTQIVPSLIVPAANAVIDLSAERAWATHNQLPAPVLLLLTVCMLVSAGLMGHSSGQVRYRHIVLWIAMNLLIMLVLFVVVDFDRSKRGLIQISNAPLTELQRSMEGGH